jgi:thiol-disulfide isomerase/thioredoxin
MNIPRYRASRLVLFVCALIALSLMSFGCGRESGESQDDKGAPRSIGHSAQRGENIKVTFVELGSVRCIPCKRMQPIMKEIEEEYRGQVEVVFHDVWTQEGKPYAMQYQVRLIPTQVFLDSDGKEYFRHEGFFPKDELVKVLKQQGVE